MLRNFTFLMSLFGAAAVFAVAQWGRKRHTQSEDDRLADIIRRFRPALEQARSTQ